MPSEKDALAAIRPLRLIALGGLLCIFEYVPPPLSGEGWRVDLFNDAVGMILIAMGAARLGRIRVHPPWNDHYGSTMKLVRFVALLGVAVAVMGHFVFRRPPTLVLFLSIYQVMLAGAAVLACLCMRWLCAESGLRRSLKSWNITTGVVVCFFSFPLTAVSATDFLSIMVGKMPARPLGDFEVLALGILGIPFLYVLMSTSRMAREAGRAADAKLRGGWRC